MNGLLRVAFPSSRSLPHSLNFFPPLFVVLYLACPFFVHLLLLKINKFERNKHNNNNNRTNIYLLNVRKYVKLTIISDRLYLFTYTHVCLFVCMHLCRLAFLPFSFWFQAKCRLLALWVTPFGF